MCPPKSLPIAVPFGFCDAISSSYAENGPRRIARNAASCDAAWKPPVERLSGRCGSTQLCRLIFRDSAERFRLHIHAYCLMTNHVHFVVIPESAEAIWRTFQRSQGMYAAKFNIKYGLCGHLWQARPYSSVLDEKHSPGGGAACGAQPGSGGDARRPRIMRGPALPLIAV